jgi:ribosome-associated translation inhibitor RaiA
MKNDRRRSYNNNNNTVESIKSADYSFADLRMQQGVKLWNTAVEHTSKWVDTELLSLGLKLEKESKLKFLNLMLATIELKLCSDDGFLFNIVICFNGNTITYETTATEQYVEYDLLISKLEHLLVKVIDKKQEYYQLAKNSATL